MGMEHTDDQYTDYERRVMAAFHTVREASGAHQIALSVAAGMGRNQVGRYERLERHANLGDLERLLDAIRRTAPRRVSVTTVFDLLAYAEGKVKLTVEERGE